MTPDDIRGLKHPAFTEHADIDSVIQFVQRRATTPKQAQRTMQIVGVAINTTLETVAKLYEEELAQDDNTHE